MTLSGWPPDQRGCSEGLGKAHLTLTSEHILQQLARGVAGQGLLHELDVSGTDEVSLGPAVLLGKGGLAG